MKGNAKLLPERLWNALLSIAKRICGGVLICLVLWAIGALFFYDPYLDGFAVVSTFGNQTWMGYFVGFCKYIIGFIPTLFLLLYIGRWGLGLLSNWGTAETPEYNILRFFVTVCVGAIGFGLILPQNVFGGMLGAIAAGDMGNILGNVGIIIGILCVGVFLVMAAGLLHIKLSHVKKSVYMMCRGINWFLSVFHLAPAKCGLCAMTEPGADADEQEEDTDVDDDVSSENHKSRKPAQARGAEKRARRTSDKVLTTSAEYRLPEPAFLEASHFGKNVITPELKQRAQLMENHFAEYNVRGRVDGIRPGPIVTLYEFLPESGMRMVDISKTVVDMTRAMATERIRIAPIPGTQYVGVEMVNLKPCTVRYRTLMENEAFITSKYKIPLALGVNIGGNPMYYDLAKMPHMLIAGRTGSGKSVFVQSIITSIVYHFTPDKCKLIIIDPKGVDFGFWDDIPHLITPIVKLDPTAAVNALKWAVREMEERYKQLQLLNARNIESYNEAVVQKRDSGEVLTRQVAVGTDEETGELLFETQQIELKEMPYIVIVIDEVADLMQLARKEVESCVQRIAQKARAAGIHLVMATQRPDATTITGVIKANFPTRVSFQARSNIDSMTTLGEKGAENLLACGDMLFSEAGKVPVRIHGAFISDEELNKIGNFLRRQAEPEYASGVTDGENSGTGDGMGAAPSAAELKAEKDGDLYTQAKECVIRDKKPTISYIQRRLGVGYNKAAGFMERMEQEGVVSAPDANNKRHIL